jgi:prepilin-type N-terminal cleavage/methylation domain-containing protein
MKNRFCCLSQNNKNKGFSLIELIAVIAIIAVLSLAAYIGIQRTQDIMKNNRVTNDLIAIESALNQYFHDNNEEFPKPSDGGDMNLLCFDASAAYVHDCEENGAFMQGVIDNELLSKRYLPEVPIDPWSGARYAYGVTLDGKYFMVAGLYHDGDSFIAYSISNVYKGFHLPSLIRAYDGPDFVTHKGDRLPYSSERYMITGQLVNISGGVSVEDEEGDDKPDITLPLVPGDTVITDPTGTADIFFSDGSVTRVLEDTKLEILDTSSAEEGKDDNIITKIRLKLFQGKIWNKVVRLAEKSEFNIETTQAIAGVRGTEFGIMDDTKLIVYSGEVRVRKKTPAEMADDEPVDFSKDDGDLLSAVVTDEGSVKGFSMFSPGPGYSITPTEQIFIDDGQRMPLHSGLFPYVLAFDIPQMPDVNAFFVVNVGVNGLTSKDYSATGFEVFPKDLFSSVGERMVNDGVLKEDGTPVEGLVHDVATSVSMPSDLSANTFTYDANEDVYKIALSMPIEVDGRYHPETMAIRMYRVVSGKRIYSGFSWPLMGFNVAAVDLSTDGIFVDFTEGDLYEDLKDSGVCTIILTSPSKLSDVYPDSEFRWRPSSACEAVANYEVKVFYEDGSDAFTSLSSANFFSPTIPFAPNTDYTLTITAIDGSGTVLAKKTFQFTTGEEATLDHIAVEGDDGIDVSDTGETYTYKAYAYFDGSMSDITSDCAWSIDADTDYVGTITGGVFDPEDDYETYVIPGGTKEIGIICEYMSDTGELAVGLTAPSAYELEWIDIVDPDFDSPLVVGLPHKFEVMGHYSNGDELNVTSLCTTWNYSPPTAGSMSGYTFTPSEVVSTQFFCNTGMADVTEWFTPSVPELSLVNPTQNYYKIYSEVGLTIESPPPPVNVPLSDVISDNIGVKFSSDDSDVDETDYPYFFNNATKAFMAQRPAGYRLSYDRSDDMDFSVCADTWNDGGIMGGGCNKDTSFYAYFPNNGSGNYNADYAVGTNSGVNYGGGYIAAEGLSITTGDGNYVAYNGENNLSQHSEVTLTVNRIELRDTPFYTYLFDAVDDDGNHVELAKSDMGELRLKVISPDDTILNQWYIGSFAPLDTMSTENVNIYFYWNSAKAYLEINNEDGDVVFAGNITNNIPSRLNFGAASKFYIGSKEGGNLNDGNNSQYNGFIKSVEVKNLPPITEAECIAAGGVWNGTYCEPATAPPPVITALAIDCSGGPVPGACIGGGYTYPISFTVTDADSCTANLSFTTELIPGTSTLGSTDTISLAGDNGSFNYTTGAINGDVINIAVTCTGSGGDDTESIDLTLE